MCRHIYDWNIVNCDVKQPIYLTLPFNYLYYPTLIQIYTHVLYARLCLDTCVYHVIHVSLTWDYYCLFGVGGKLPNSEKDRPKQLVKNIIFRTFSLSWRPMTHVSYPFLPHSEVCLPRVCTVFSFLSINSSQYHVIVNHVTVFSVFIGPWRVKLNCVTLSVKFEYLYLRKLLMICNKVEWDIHY